jgi:hypothetical protein
VSGDIAGHLRFRPSPGAGGWLRRVEFSGPDWTMAVAAEETDDVPQRFPCRHASRVFLPDWFEDQLERNLGRMMELETGDAVV